MEPIVNETAPDETWTQIAPLLDTAMEKLGKKDHDALVLRFFENKNFAQVGAALGASEDAAKMRVGRALEKLRKFFSSHGVHSTTAIIAGTVSANSIQAAPATLTQSVTAVALAKGAAASASTLTLIKGALKLMAWSKTKTATLSVVIVLLGIGATTITLNALLPLPDVQGAWEGLVDTEQPGMGVHRGESPKSLTVLKITETNGIYQAMVENISAGMQGQFTTFTYKYPYVHVELAADDFSAVGKMNRFGKKMIWTCQQGTNTFPIVYQKTTQPAPFPEPLAYDDFAPRAGSALQGFWTGMIGRAKAQAGPLNLPISFEVKIARAADGTYRADFYAPDESYPRQPTAVSDDGTSVKLMPLNGCGMFEGQLRDGGKEMTGDWIQDGYRTRTTLMQEDYSNAWLTPNLNSPLVDLAYPQVRIVRTRFPGSSQIWENGEATKWGGINMPIKVIMRVAYKWWLARVVFAVPEPKGRYDFIASLPQGSAEALQRELQKRFGLVGRVEIRDEEVLVLQVRTPNAPGLKPPNVGGEQDWSRRGEYICDDRPLSSKARCLGLQRYLEGTFNVPVVDETGLTNHFSIDLKWDDEGRKDPNHAILKEALADQLGLELVPGRRSIKMLVVEQGELLSPDAEAGLTK